MEFLYTAFFTDYGYWAVLFVLIICGFGVPIPGRYHACFRRCNSWPLSWKRQFPLNVSREYDWRTCRWFNHVLAWSHLRHSNSSFPPNAQTSHLRTSQNWYVKNLTNTATAYYLWLVSYLVYVHQFTWFLALPVASAILAFVLIDFCAAITFLYPIWVYLGEFGAKKFRLVTRAN